MYDSQASTTRPRRVPGSASWARDVGMSADGTEQLLGVAHGDGKTVMADSVATGTSLVSNGRVGADLISLRAGERFAPHTHAGDHILMVVSGEGTLTLDGTVYPTAPGQVFIVDGDVPHAVGAVSDHQIVAIGSPHRPVDAPDRMLLVEYQAVLSASNEIQCLICDVSSVGVGRQRLHDLGCCHCSCDDCC